LGSIQYRANVWFQGLFKHTLGEAAFCSNWRCFMIWSISWMEGFDSNLVSTLYPFWVMQGIDRGQCCDNACTIDWLWNICMENILFYPLWRWSHDAVMTLAFRNLIVSTIFPCINYKLMEYVEICICINTSNSCSLDTDVTTQGCQSDLFYLTY